MTGRYLVEQRIRPNTRLVAARRPAPFAKILGPLLLVLACAPQLGCGLLIAAVASKSNGASTEEGKAWLAEFATNYDTVVAAAKLDKSESAAAYFNAVLQAHACHEAGHGQMEEGWTFTTAEGQKLRVGDAKSKCVELMFAIRKHGASEEGCGYKQTEVIGGRQYANTHDWTTDLDVVNDPGTRERPGLSEALGRRQLVSCDKLPAKTGQPPPIWKKEHVALAEKGCGAGAVIAYTATDWAVSTVNLSSGDRYLERRLKAECWYPKAPVGPDFLVPPACDEGDTPPEGAHSCTTAAAQLVVK